MGEKQHPYSHAVLTTVLLATAFLDGVVAMANTPVLLLQAKHVAFPSGAVLALSQALYLLPQLVTTSLAEMFAVRYGALVALMLSLASSAGSMGLVTWSMMRNQLGLFLVSRLVNGLCRHDKLLFQFAAEQVRVAPELVRRAALYGMMAGMLSAGVAGDAMRDAGIIAQTFTSLEVVTASLALLLLLYKSSVSIAPTRTRLRTKATALSLVVQPYVHWLNSSLPRVLSTTKRHGLITPMLCLLAAAVAAGVNQCTYPLAKRFFDVSYSFIGAHLCLEIALQSLLVPWLRAHYLQLPRAPALQKACALLLLAGVWFVPYVETAHALLYYALTLICVDMPAYLLYSTLTEHIVAQLPLKQRPFMHKLLSQLLQFVKLFSAPLRICVGEYFVAEALSVRYISVPAAIFVFTALMTSRLVFALSAIVLYVCTVLPRLRQQRTATPIH